MVRAGRGRYVQEWLLVDLQWIGTLGWWGHPTKSAPDPANHFGSSPFNECGGPAACDPTWLGWGWDRKNAPPQEAHVRGTFEKWFCFTRFSIETW